MQVQVTGKHVDVGEALRSRVSDELSTSIEKYFDRGGGADVVVSREGQSFKVDCAVTLASGQQLTTHGVGGDAHVAFDAAMEKMSKRIRRYKNRLKDHSPAANAKQAESAAYFTTGLADRGDVDYALESAAAKVWNSDALDRAVDELVQITGGRGFVRGYPYERMYRDARITRIFEGTNEILRLFVGLSGMQGPGEYLRRIGEALKNPIEGFGLLGGFATERVRLALRRGEPSIDTDLHPTLVRHWDHLASHTRDLRAAVERTIRRHGRAVIDRQFVVARIADMAIELYVRAATLSRTQALLEAHDAGATHAPPLTSSATPLDDESMERLLRLCDLACQRSGLRFRAARVALNDDRDSLLRTVAADVLSTMS